MKRSTIVLCLSLCFAAAVNGVKVVIDEEGGFYWRNFNGRIPKDAYVASFQNGKKTYVGQALHLDLLIPGYITDTDKTVVFEYKNLAKRGIENVKILCTRNPDQLEWQATSNDQIRSIEGNDLVNGGYETNTNTYIGRGIVGDNYYIGKLLVTEFGFTGLHLGVNGKAYHLDTYEVLRLNSEKATTTESTPGSTNSHVTCKDPLTSISIYL